MTLDVIVAAPVPFRAYEALVWNMSAQFEYTGVSTITWCVFSQERALTGVIKA